MNVKHLRRKLNPVQQQLLGLTTGIISVDGAKGRSSRYYPRPGDVPLANPDQQPHRRTLRSVARRILQTLCR
jgi:hypothetical protein